MPIDTVRLRGGLERAASDKAHPRVLRHSLGPYSDAYIKPYGATDRFLYSTYDTRSGLLWPRKLATLEPLMAYVLQHGKLLGIDLSQNWRFVESLPERRHEPGYHPPSERLPE